MTDTPPQPGSFPEDQAHHAAHLLTPNWPAAQIDTGTAHPARMYDYYLGGRDNYQVDRDAANEVLAVMTEMKVSAQHNRKALRRMVEYLVDAGVRQFLDIGTGIPGVGSTGAIVRSLAPDARVVCVDNDPIVLTHGAALLADRGDRAVAVRWGDLRDPDAILRDIEAHGLLDLTRPVGVLLVAVLHFLSDADRPERIVRTLMDAMAPGSYLALTHATGDFADPSIIEQVVGVYDRATAPAVPRTYSRVAAFFGGLALVAPGVVRIADWRPDQDFADADDAWMYAGLGCKP